MRAIKNQGNEQNTYLRLPTIFLLIIIAPTFIWGTISKYILNNGVQRGEKSVLIDNNGFNDINDNTRKSNSSVKNRANINLPALHSEINDGGFENKYIKLHSGDTERERIIGSESTEEVDHPQDNVFEFNLDKIDLHQYAYISYDIFGNEGGAGVVYVINNAIGVGGYVIGKNSKWSHCKELIDITKLKEGNNQILFNTRGKGILKYRLKNIKIEFEDAAPSSFIGNTVKIDSIACFNNDRAYVKGVIPPDKCINKIIIGDQVLQIIGNEFEGVINCTKNHMTNGLELSVYNQDSLLEKIHVNIKQAGWITKILDVSDANTKRETFMSWMDNSQQPSFYNSKGIEALSFSDVAPISNEIINTTLGSYAYRLNTQEENPNLVTFKIFYDPIKLPEGYSPNAINLFTFNTKIRNWVKVPIDSVNIDHNFILFKGNTGPEYLTGVIKVPDAPPANLFMANSIQDLKAADPTAKINLMTPPEANQSGAAVTSYPIEIPPGRMGLQPSVNVEYNSEGGNDWMGLGWNINVPCIEVNTKWGVPTYDQGTESESYLLDGKQIMLQFPKDKSFYLPQRATPPGPMGTVNFYQRVDNGLLKIQRIGNYKSAFKWEVIDKSGTKYYYGSTANSTLVRPTDGVIAKWMLDSIVDINGNKMAYLYELNIDPSTNSRQLYLKSINYNKHVSESIPQYYKISFIRNGQFARKDNSLNSRFGFNVHNHDLLNEIVISREGSSGTISTIRKYKFVYVTKLFEKTLLQKIEQYSGDNTLFNVHEMDYYDDINGGSLFESEVSVPVSIQLPVLYPSLSIDHAETGGSLSLNEGFTAGINVGVAPPGPESFNVLAKTVNISGNFNFSYNSSSSIIGLTDIDGDGIPDKLFKDGPNIYYIKNSGNGFTGSKILIPDIHNFGKTNSRTLGFGLEARYLVFGGINKNWTRSFSPTYLSDVNADGLVDIVNNGKIYFCHNTAAGIRYSLDSKNTPNELIKNMTIASDCSSEAVESQFLQTADIVRVWEAPKAGTINISGIATPMPVNLDGVRLQIEQYHDLAGTNTILATYNLSNISQITNLSNVSVARNDKIFFRVNVAREVQNDKVIWKPKVVYTITSAGEPRQDANKYIYHNSGSDESFVVASTVPTQIEPGNYSITWNPFPIDNRSSQYLDPNTVSDVINLRITIFDRTSPDGTISNQNVFNYYSKLDILNDGILVPAIQPFNVPANSGNIRYVKAEIIANSEVNWNYLANTWRPILTETTYNKVQYLVPDITNYRLITNYMPYKPTNTTQFNFKVTHLNAITFPSNTAKRNVYLTVKGYRKQVLDCFRDGLGARKFKLKYTIQGSTVVKKYIFNPAGLGAYNDSTLLAGPENFYVNKTGYSNQFDTLFFEYFADDSLDAAAIAYYQFISSNNRLIFEASKPDIPIVCNVYYKSKEKYYGKMYRNWGQFAYTPKVSGTNLLPIDVTSFSKTKMQDVRQNDLSQSDIDLAYMEDDYDIYKSKLGTLANLNADGLLGPIPLIPDKEKEKWKLSDKLFASRDTMYTNRVIQMESTNTEPDGIANYSGNDIAYGFTKKSKSTSKSRAHGVSLGVSYSSSDNSGVRTSLNEFMDLNGDGYPDILQECGIQLTNPRGGLEPAMPLSTNYLEQGFSVGSGNSAGGTMGGISFFINTLKSNTESKASSLDNKSGPGVSTQFFNNNDYSVRLLNDISGDGLVDFIPGANNDIKLNQGAVFDSPLQLWPYGIRCSESTTNSFSVGGSYTFNFGKNSLTGGVSGGKNFNYGTTLMQDINGDGLPDKLSNQGIFINNGLGFSASSYSPPDLGLPPILNIFQRGLRSGESTSFGLNGNYTYETFIEYTAIVLKLGFSIGIDASKTVDKDRIKIIDFNGDGYPDVVKSDFQGDLRVMYSKIGRSNKLKEIKRPLGSSIVIDYDYKNPDGTKVGSTFEDPHGHWIMKSCKVVTGSSQVSFMKKFYYKKGLYDRREREFLGFGKITTVEDLQGSDYRKTEITYLTAYPGTAIYDPAKSTSIRQYYYKRGLVDSVTVYDNTGAIINQELTEYKFFNGSTPDYTTPVSLFATSGISDPVFTDLTWTFPVPWKKTKKFREPQSGAAEIIQTSTIDEIDAFGNITKYTVTGPSTFQALMSYHYIFSSGTYLPGVVKSHEVGNRKTEITSFTPNTGQPLIIKNYLNATTAAQYDMTYNSTGTLGTIKYPAGEAPGAPGARLNVTLGYESTMKAYNVSYIDNMGYFSRSFINYDFGVADSVIDINNNTIVTKFDKYGRILKYKGPYYSNIPIIIHDYETDLTGADGTTYAITKHYDPKSPSDYIYTSTFVDQLGRPVLIKKEMDSECSDCSVSSAGVRYSLMNAVEFDALGRIVKSYAPKDEISCGGSDDAQARIYTAVTDQNYLTDHLYDVKDREVSSTVHYGGNIGDQTTTSDYTVSGGLFMNKITLPRGNYKESATDSWGRLLRSTLGNSSEQLNTTFSYNLYGNLLTSTDPLNNTTSNYYDNLGRVDSTIHPDAGRTKYTYLLSGQIKTMTNARNQLSTYTYNYNQLLQEQYDTDITTYTYGSSSATGNKRGRITSIQDLSGMRTFSYGPLGEIIDEQRQIVIPNAPTKTFNTHYHYDTWGRVDSIIYPDGEVITYTFDKGGNTKSMSTNQQLGKIVSCAKYDAAGHLKYIKYGNNTTNEYEYSPQEILNTTKLVNQGNAISYEYDENLNIKQMHNSNYSLNKSFAYDLHDRLSDANGSLVREDTTFNFKLSMTYDEVFNFKTKNQSVYAIKTTETSSQIWRLKPDYNATYTYNDIQHPHAVSKIEEIGFWGDTLSRHFYYDKTGNTRRISKDTFYHPERRMYWDQHNRLQVVSNYKPDNQLFSYHHYIYDAGGERILRNDGGGVSLQINNDTVVTQVDPGKYTLYPSPLMMVGQYTYTKHYYMGSMRVSSATVYDQYNNPNFSGGIENKLKLKEIKLRQQDNLRNILVQEGIKIKFPAQESEPELQLRDQDSENECFRYLFILYYQHAVLNDPCKDILEDILSMYDPCDGVAYLKSAYPECDDLQIGDFNPNRYWYHSDHLGSSSYITDKNGTIQCTYEYLPYGEFLLDKEHFLYAQRYKFSGKESDEETGYYYFGARYYDPRTSQWLSVDPLAGKYPHASPYNYCLGNPVKFIDPDGNKVINGDRLRLNYYSNVYNGFKNSELYRKFGGLTRSQVKDTYGKGAIKSWKKFKSLDQKLGSKVSLYEDRARKTDEIIEQWSKSSPNTFNKVDQLKVDMLLGVDEGVSSGKPGEPFGFTSAVELVNGVYSYTVSGLSDNGLQISINRGVNLFSPDEETGEYSLNHEAGHFIFAVEHPDQYLEDRRNIGPKAYNGGHHKDARTGQEAKKYGSIQDIDK